MQETTSLSVSLTKNRNYQIFAKKSPLEAQECHGALQMAMAYVQIFKLGLTCFESKWHAACKAE